MRKLLLVAVIVIFAAGLSFARDAKESRKAEPARKAARLGLGFNSQINGGIASAALRYWERNDLGFEGIFGFSFGDNRYIDLGGKILGAIKKDQNLDLYGFGLLGIENYSIKDGKSDTTFLVGGGFGIEFFLQGLPNLGLNAELGIGYNSGTKQFGTFADWLPTVGLRYYFSR